MVDNLIGKKFDFSVSKNIIVWYDCPRIFIQHFNDKHYLFSDEYEEEKEKGNWLWYHRIIPVKDLSFMNSEVIDINLIDDLYKKSNDYVYSISDGETILGIIESNKKPYDF